MNFDYAKLNECFVNINQFIKNNSTIHYKCILSSMKNLMTFVNAKDDGSKIIIKPTEYNNITEILTVV